MTCVLMTVGDQGEGQWKKVDEMWFQKFVTKVLINLQFRLGRLIDTKAPKTPEVSTECRNDLVRWRASELSKNKSAHMHSISRRKASKASQIHGLREAALIKLVITPSQVFFYAHLLSRTYSKGMPKTPWAQGGPRCDTRDLWHRW
jgi:hypothetical protein